MNKLLGLLILTVASLASAQTVPPATYYTTPQFNCHIYSGELGCFQYILNANGVEAGQDFVGLLGKDWYNPTSAFLQLFDSKGNSWVLYTLALTSPTSGTFPGGSVTWSIIPRKCRCGYKGGWTTVYTMTGSMTLN